MSAISVYTISCTCPASHRFSYGHRSFRHVIIKSESTPVIWTVIIRLRLVFKPSEPTPSLKWIFVKWFWISTPDSNNTVPVTFQLLYLKSSLRVYSQGQDTTWSRPFQNSEPGGPGRWPDDEKKSRLGHQPKPILFNSPSPGSALTYRAQIEPVVFMNYPITWFDRIWRDLTGWPTSRKVCYLGVGHCLFNDKAFVYHFLL